MKTESQSKIKSAGFSLIEMLTFVCILGIMATMAIPLFGNTAGARQAKDQRNAQNFCSMATAASAAGIAVISGTSDVEVVMHRLTDGLTVTKGPLSGRTFKVPNVTDEEIKFASDYLEIRNGSLLYSSTALPRL